jgi:hypothetical protein
MVRICWSDSKGCNHVSAGVEELSAQQVHQLVRKEVTKATASRISREHIRLLKVRSPPGWPALRDSCLLHCHTLILVTLLLVPLSRRPVPRGRQQCGMLYPVFIHNHNISNFFPMHRSIVSSEITSWILHCC